jgi:adenine-specific DNA-methyltransferase
MTELRVIHRSLFDVEEPAQVEDPLSALRAPLFTTINTVPGTKDQLKLELHWPHKSSRLLYDFDEEGRLSPRFVDLCTPEPRALVDLKQYGTEKKNAWNPETSNLLIRGDNLVALKTLARYYAGKVKVIYIDPPFNTGIAFEEYDDGLEHSTWLTMMRDRLELLRDLLAPDGSLWCEIDDTELGYLNVLLDEVFGRKNRIATVSMKRSAATGHKAINPGPINVTDFLFGYAKQVSKWKYNPQLVLRQEYDKQYNKYIPNIKQSYKKWRIESLPEIFAKEMGFTSAAAARKAMGAAAFNKGKIDFALKNAEHVVRTAIPNYKGISKAARDMVDKSRSDSEIHCLKRDDYSDMYFIKGDRILFLADKVQENGDEGPSLAEKLTNFWDDIPWQGIAKEGGVDFPKNKKPERLLYRVLSMASNKGDLVLDSFAGSGTTGAVAHKMGRRWIMVELGEHAEKLALKRMKNVVAGKDSTGVSKLLAYSGGGGFRYMTLGSPLLNRDEDLGLLVLNPEYTNGLLINAVCLREGFVPTGDEWLHGQGTGFTFAHVTEEFVTPDFLDVLREQCFSRIPEGSTLTLYCLHHEEGLKAPEGTLLRRIPVDFVNKFCL